MNTKDSLKIVERYQNRAEILDQKIISFTGELNHPPESIFPLLCPAREADWIPDWDAQLLHTMSGYAEENCVFRTYDSDHKGGGTWICITYNPSREIEYIRVSPHLVTRIRIILTLLSPNVTLITWNKFHSALDSIGNKQIGKDHSADKMKKSLLTMLAYYLDNGEIIPKIKLAMHVGHD